MGALSPNFVSGHIAFVKKKKEDQFTLPRIFEFLDQQVEKKRNYGIYHAS